MGVTPLERIRRRSQSLEEIINEAKKLYDKAAASQEEGNDNEEDNSGKNR